jgi:predicted O-methyltransferase YrrM
MDNFLRDIHARAIAENAEIKYLPENGSLRMSNHNMPLSIKNDEFTFIKNFVIEHNLKRGYEIATAFGISATAFGLGLKETGGRMVTMDAYIEEQYNDCAAYRSKKATYKDADGYKSMQFLIDAFDLDDIIIPVVGWSPDDTADAITGVFGDEKLDFVFIDALHYDEAVIADVNSILPFLDDRYAIFFHDVHCFSENVENFLVETFGKSWTVPPQCRYIAGSQRGGYNLGYIYNA